jgi:hypothetical protein
LTRATFLFQSGGNMKLTRALAVLALLVSIIPAQAGDTMVVAPPAPRQNPLAPVGRVVFGGLESLGEWFGSIFIGSAEELGKTAVGATKGTGKLVSNSSTGLFKGMARYANDTKSDNE